MSRVLRIALGLVGTVACAIPSPALAQGNIDAGKTPAQIFSDTCTACHRNARELNRTTEGFLRAHYVPSREEAAAMAGYLAAVANDPRAATAPQQKRAAPTGLGQTPPAEVPTRGRPGEQAKSTPAQAPKAARREPPPAEAKASPPQPQQPASAPPPLREPPAREARAVQAVAPILRVRRPAASLEVHALTALVGFDTAGAPPSVELPPKAPPVLEEIEQ